MSSEHSPTPHTVTTPRHPAYHRRRLIFCDFFLGDDSQVAVDNQSSLEKGVLVTVEDSIPASTVQDLIRRGHNVSVLSGTARQSFGRYGRCFCDFSLSPFCWLPPLSRASAWFGNTNSVTARISTRSGSTADTAAVGR
jgi:hypothetical protein